MRWAYLKIDTCAVASPGRLCQKQTNVTSYFIWILTVHDQVLGATKDRNGIERWKRAYRCIHRLLSLCLLFIVPRCRHKIEVI